MLLLDCGNRALKCRIVTAEKLQDRRFTLPAEAHAFEKFIDRLGPMPTYLASVADADTTEWVLGLLRACAHLGLATELRVCAQLGSVRNGYRDYRQLGVDRWLTLLAVAAWCEQDALIIDAGSAITVDLLEAQSGHLGGAILPGFKTDERRFKAMFPQIDFNDPVLGQTERDPGRSTRECIRMDGFPAEAGLILRLARAWSAQWLNSPRIVLCGQDAPLLAEKFGEVGIDAQLEPGLVFKGMLQQIRLQG